MGMQTTKGFNNRWYYEQPGAKRVIRLVVCLKLEISRVLVVPIALCRSELFGILIPLYHSVFRGQNGYDPVCQCGALGEFAAVSRFSSFVQRAS